MATRKPRKPNKPSVFDDENLSNEWQENQNTNATKNTENMGINEEELKQDGESFKSEEITNETPSNVEIDKNAVGENFNPLEGEVKKRNYASNFGAQNTVAEVDRVPEPSITNLPPPPPPNKDSSSPFITGSGGGGSKTPTGSPTQQPQQKLNPEMAAMPEKDARAASTLLVDAILGGYKQFWGLAYEYVKVSEEEIVNWVMKDQISLDVKIAINTNGEEADLRSIYEMYNSQSKEALTVDLTTEDFIKVRDAMIREFTRRGWGISDMQYIIQHFVRDAAQRAISVYQLKGTINNFTKGIMAQYEETKKLRAELTDIKAKVEASEPTKIKKEPTNEVRENPKKTREDASQFVESYEIRKDAKREPEVREVPFYGGEKDIQPEKKDEVTDVTDVAVYTVVNPKTEDGN